jgi:AcrR family transcriptional regulator
MSTTPTTKPKKSDLTKAHIQRCAFELFQSKGFDSTTMRDVAEAAKMSLGSTYYYFNTKEELVLSFYVDSCADFQAIAQEEISKTKNFETRLINILQKRLLQLHPHRTSYGALARAALNPESTISPFGEETIETRLSAMRIFEDTLIGSNLKIANTIKEQVIVLLWLFHLGILFFWLHDRSKDQAKTTLLIKKSVPLLSKSLKISSLPVVRSIIKPVLDLITELLPVEKESKI